MDVGDGCDGCGEGWSGCGGRDVMDLMKERFSFNTIPFHTWKYNS